MSAYTQEQETEIVRDAMMLTTAIETEEQQIYDLKRQTFKDLQSFPAFFSEKPPLAPRRQVLALPAPVQPVIPAPPKVEYTFREHFQKNLPKFIALFVAVGVTFTAMLGSGEHPGLILLFLFLHFLSWGGLIVYFIVSRVKTTNERDRLNQEAAVSPQYLQAVEQAKQLAQQQQAQAEDQVRRKQAQIDAEYQAGMQRYETILVPDYEKRLAEKKAEYEKLKETHAREKEAWESDRAQMIRYLEDDIRINRETLENLYDTSRLISLTYRDTDILRWLYDDMRTSNHDIRYATELLDRDRARRIAEDVGRDTMNMVTDLKQAMQDSFDFIANIIREGNRVLADMTQVMANVEANTAGVYDEAVSANENLEKMRRDQNVSSFIAIRQRYKYGQK